MEAGTNDTKFTTPKSVKSTITNSVGIVKDINGYEYKLDVDRSAFIVDGLQNVLAVTDNYIVGLSVNGRNAYRYSKDYPYKEIDSFSIDSSGLQRPPYFYGTVFDDGFCYSHNQTSDTFLYLFIPSKKIVVYGFNIKAGNKIISCKNYSSAAYEYKVIDITTGNIEFSNTLSSESGTSTIVGATTQYMYYINSSNKVYTLKKVELSTGTKSVVQTLPTPAYTTNNMSSNVLYMSENDSLIYFYYSQKEVYLIYNFNPSTGTLSRIYNSISTFQPFSISDSYYSLYYVGTLNNGNIVVINTSAGNMYILSSSMSIISTIKSYGTIIGSFQKRSIVDDRYINYGSGVYDMVNKESIPIKYTSGGGTIYDTVETGNIFTEKQNSLLPVSYEYSSSYADYVQHIFNAKTPKMIIKYAVQL